MTQVLGTVHKPKLFSFLCQRLSLLWSILYTFVNSHVMYFVHCAWKVFPLINVADAQQVMTSLYQYPLLAIMTTLDMNNSPQHKKSNMSKTHRAILTFTVLIKSWTVLIYVDRWIKFQYLSFLPNGNSWKSRFRIIHADSVWNYW